jgi:oxygen-independent coproporphyrinogen-3 oxidase
LEGAEGLYNVYMMEEVHSIFAAGAGAVSKMVDYAPADGSKPLIERLFYPKYPYEYLEDESTEEKLGAIESFYRNRGLLD